MEISTTNKIKKSLAIHRLFQFLGGKKDRVVCGLVANCEAAATQFRQMGWRPPECHGRVQSNYRKTGNGEKEERKESSVLRQRPLRESLFTQNFQ